VCWRRSGHQYQRQCSLLQRGRYTTDGWTVRDLAQSREFPADEPDSPHLLAGRSARAWEGGVRQQHLDLAPRRDPIREERTYGFVGVSRPGGPLGRRVSVAACPSPDGSSARASAKGGERGGRRLA
jgi:hypothetical protein